jgi:hypothetical protein
MNSTMGRTVLHRLTPPGQLQSWFDSSGKARAALIWLSNGGILTYQHAMISRLGPGPQREPILPD